MIELDGPAVSLFEYKGDKGRVSRVLYREIAIAGPNPVAVALEGNKRLQSLQEALKGKPGAMVFWRQRPRVDAVDTIQSEETQYVFRARLATVPELPRELWMKLSGRAEDTVEALAG